MQTASFHPRWLRRRAVTVLALLVIASLNGCARAGFEAAGTDGTFPSHHDAGGEGLLADGRPMLDGGATDGLATDGRVADTAPPPGGIVFRGLLGTSQCVSGGLTTLTVPSNGPVPAGQTVIIYVALRASPVVAVSADDEHQNVYQVDLDVRHDSASSGMRTVVLSSRLTTSLASGETIQVHHPDAEANAVVVSTFSGIADQARVDRTTWMQGESGNTAVSLTSDEDGLVYSFVSINQDVAPILTNAALWTIPNRLAIDCGGAPRQAYGLVATRTFFATENASLSAVLPGNPKWLVGMVHYRGGP
jgi:hypothetical protein